MTQIADQTLNCCDCPNTFLFTPRDQEFFAQQGWTPPRRCKTCRDQKKARANEGGGNRPVSSQGFQRPPVQTRVPVQPRVQTPFVQYRPPVQSEPPHSGVSQNFPRSFGPDAQPKAFLKDDFKGGKKDSERRRDAYEERKKRRKSKSWEDSDEE
jgi:hypothetical protein